MLLLGNPAAIDALAATLDRRAEDLAEVGRRAAQRANDASWACAKADRFRYRMTDHQRGLDHMAADLRDIAADLRRSAAALRAEYAFLAKIEGRIRAAISGFVHSPGVQPPWEGTGWSPHNLPRPGDPAWRDVAKALRIR
jgi:hypothetical protein